MANTITRILVPMDFSPHADRAREYATSLARRLGATVTLAHVIEDPYLSGAWVSEFQVPHLVDVLDGLRAAAERQLAAAQRTAAASGCPVDTAVVIGRPADAIAEFAADGGFDLIVMGTHGRTGVSHLVMGSVAERVLRQAPCPVLTLRAGPAAATNGGHPAAA